MLAFSKVRGCSQILMHVKDHGLGFEEVEIHYSNINILY
jgi:hypothetical protein